MSGLRQVSLLLYAASLALSSPTRLLSSEAVSPNVKGSGLATRADDEYRWAAIGDSFSAGPGAGSPFDDEPNQCYRNVGSYPAQLNRDFPFRNPAMQFLSCTGAVVDDLIELQIPAMEADQQVVTLSIGGNDIGFGDILRACVFKPGGPVSADCDKTIFEAYAYIGNELEKTLGRAYDALFNRVATTSRRSVFIQLYPDFFATGTDWCNDQTMGVVTGYKPRLDNELRRKLNKLSSWAREKMKAIIDRWASDGFNRKNFYYLDQYDNFVYPGHRFCESGFESLDHPDTWFFTIGGNDSPKLAAQELMQLYDPDTCADDPLYNTDFAFGWYCDTVRYASTLEGDDANFHTFPPESVLKAFHPKTAAFTVIKGIHALAIDRQAWPLETYVSQGNLQCRPTRSGQEEYHSTREDMLQAMDQFCKETASMGINPGHVEGVYHGQIVSASRDDKAGDCPPIDVTSDGFVDMCKSRLITAVDECDKKKESDLWKQGGIFYRDCITWSISKQSDQS